METIEARQGRAEQDGPTANIEQVLERIRQSPAPDGRKKVVFPRESVNASEFRIPKPGESVQTPEPEPRPAATTSARPQPATQAKPVEKPQSAAQAKPAAVVAPALKPVETVQPAAAVPQPAAPKVPATRPVPGQAPAQVTRPASARPATQVQKTQKPVAKAQASRQVRHKDAVKAVLLDNTDRTAPKSTRKITDVDLEAFMRDAEKTEERDVQCREQTMKLLEQISQRTGCTAEDVAAQAVACVAAAIQDSGFTFCLPMQAELGPRKK